MAEEYEEYVVAEHHRNTVGPDEIRSNDEGFGKPRWLGLFGKTQSNAPLTAVSEQPLELAAVLHPSQSPGFRECPQASVSIADSRSSACRRSAAVACSRPE
jgi:hypothetical protein